MPAKGDDGYVDLREVWAAVRRQLGLVATGAIVGIGLGIFLISASHPQYQAVETVLLDKDRAQLLDQVSALPSAAWSDTAVESEVQIIKSQAVALAVADRLHLADDSDFMHPPTSLIARAKSAIKRLVEPTLGKMSPPAIHPPAPANGLAPVSEHDELRNRAADILRSNLTVNPVGRSLVIDIIYTGYDPERATAIARAYGKVYQQFQLQATTAVAQDAMAWLTSRLADLKKRAQAAAGAVRDFRVKHNLVSVKGDLLSGQQLSEMTSELIQAEATTVQARAKLDALRAILKNGVATAAAGAALVADTPSGKTLTQLQSQLVELQSRYGDVVARYGTDHEQAQRLSDQVNSVKQQIFSELQQAEQGLDASWRVARSREESLRNSLKNVTSSTLQNSALATELNQLQQTADTYGQVYTEFLKRYEEASQQETLPIAPIRTISEAELPHAPVAPHKILMVIVGMLLGGMLGGAIGVLREIRERPLRTRADVRATLGVLCLGLTPKRSKHSRSAEIMRDRTLYAVQHAIEADAPRSQPYVSGISTIPGQGRSDLAAMFARFLTSRNERVLLLAVSAPEIPLAALGDPESNVIGSIDGLDRLEFGYLDPQLDDKLLASLAEQSIVRYDHVVVELPPLGESVIPDVLASALHGTVLAVAQNRTRPRLVREALDDNPRFADRLIGIVLTDAHPYRSSPHASRQGYESRAMDSALRKARSLPPARREQLPAKKA